ncbi:hypothetical protein RvY_06254 [Ramazzottius varieornatus]|uniref:Uncharacterized protein n=1 Tax=Ramazzottius varieornatus TaxID=947166 RepID=A0A1D1V1G0_RAMVA|nr:hypothetical protein RvY_06254 [Ramazzottius varieornatus]
MERQPWTGVFKDAHVDDKGAAYLMAAGYPEETAERLGPTISIMLISAHKDSFVQHIITPSVGRFNERVFKLDQVQESTITHGPNKITKCTSWYHWDEPSRTLASKFSSSNGTDIAIDLVFSEDYNSLTKYRRAGDVEAIQEMIRLA